MEAQTLGVKLVYRELDTLLAELHRLRELVQPYVTEKPIRIEQAIALNSDQEYWQEWLKKCCVACSTCWRQSQPMRYAVM